jgi:phosphoenolpyruvate carboxylase
MRGRAPTSPVVFGLGSGLVAGDDDLLRAAYREWPLLRRAHRRGGDEPWRDQPWFATGFLSLGGRPDVTDRIPPSRPDRREVLSVLQQDVLLEHKRVRCARRSRCGRHVRSCPGCNCAR